VGFATIPRREGLRNPQIHPACTIHITAGAAARTTSVTALYQALPPLLSLFADPDQDQWIATMPLNSQPQYPTNRFPVDCKL